MDRLLKIRSTKGKTTRRIHMIREETDEETNDFKIRQYVARYVEAYVWCIKRKAYARISRSEKEVDKSNNDVVSIPFFFVKKNNKRGARHESSGRQRMYYNAQEMLHKAGQSSIFTRCHSDFKYRYSLTRIGFDRIVSEIIHTSQQKLREFETQNMGF